jgi:hypothetical protein
MVLSLIQTYTACGAGLNVSFSGFGGTAPYSYSVVASVTAAGGTIDAVTGIYTAPFTLPPSVNNAYDVIQVTDATAATTTSQILIGSSLILFCDILQTQLGLANDHIYLWDQKLIEPKDYSLYIAVSVLNSKPFGNTNKFNGTTLQNVQSINMQDILQIDAISRGPAARDNKANILMALNSQYAEQQQEFNSFYIGKLPYGGNFNNLSSVDGAAIPYRFQIQVTLQYFVTLIQSNNYYDTFNQPTVITNS